MSALASSVVSFASSLLPRMLRVLVIVLILARCLSVAFASTMFGLLLLGVKLRLAVVREVLLLPLCLVVVEVGAVACTPTTILALKPVALKILA